MAFSKSLLIKGLAASTAIGGTALTIHQKDNIASLFSKAKKSWGDLECEEKDGSECSIKNGGKILIKKEGSSGSFEVSDLGEGVIKLYKAEGDNNYNEGFKFVIEDNDITGTDTNKLEQFETYEIKKGEDSETDETLKGQYYLLRKTDAKTEIEKALGLPNENCNLPDNDTSQECDITAENIGKINFGGETARVSGNGIKLSISKNTTSDYPFGYKFTFSSTSQATLTIGEKTINIKNGSSVDFKIKRSEKGNEISLENAWTAESLAKEVGLKKSEGDYWDIEEGGLKVNRDSHKETGKTKSGTPAGKIKLYKEKWEYNQGFKFSIEDGDIDLTGGASTNITKLEQFETYEIKESDGTWYLTKKGDDLEKIKSLLKVPCDLPSNGTSQECDITTENIGTINFGGETATISGNGIKLSISKETTKTEFPLGYRFTFKNSSSSQATLTIGSKTINIKAGGDIDFKIKKTDSSLSLENAWTLDFLAKKVGLKKSDGDYWDIEEGGLKVKQGSTKQTNKIKKGTLAGKIKVEENQSNYNQDFKFSIENGDIELNGGGSAILLGQFESYEIVKDNGQWYFSRKTENRGKIKSALGLPCDLPITSNESKDCDISNDKINKIKFDGAGSGTVTSSGSIQLNIHKESNRSDYPLGYKFTFKSTENPGGSTITLSSNSNNPIVLKAGTDTDFKIKRSGTNNETLSLEKAWTADALMNKVSFKKDGENTWVPGDGTMNIKQGNNNKSTNVKKNSSGTNSAKIRAYDGVSRYSQGIKFMVEEGDADLTDTENKINKLSKYETYEVFEDGSDNKWYFRRIMDSSSSIRSILGIPSTCSIPSSNSAQTSCDLDADKLKNIKFEGKPDGGAVTISENGNSVTMKISKESNDTDYPLGFKFTFPSSNSHGFTIPQATNTASITVNKNTETCFKIKESQGKLTLEKKS